MTRISLKHASSETAKPWSFDDQVFLATHYPSKGKEWCAKALGRPVDAIRMKTFRMGLKLDRTGDFFKDFQSRAASSKVGKKRPDQSLVMKRLHAEGKLEQGPESRARGSAKTQEYFRAYGHPRGALGMKHTAETKQVISERSKASHASMSDDQIYDRTRKCLTSRFESGTYAPERTGVTWHGGWRNIGGHDKYYRSAWEANYARYLEWLRSLGHIAKWEHEPHVFWFDGIKRGCVSYLPDFRVTENDGREVYHEVKGWMDARSATKIKRMAKYHPKVKLVVIEADGYRKITKSVAAFIPGWEYGGKGNI